MNKPANPIQIKGRLPADSLHPLMVVLGIEYLAQEGGANAALLKAHSNPLAIVHVSGL